MSHGLLRTGLCASLTGPMSLHRHGHSPSQYLVSVFESVTAIEGLKKSDQGTN